MSDKGKETLTLFFRSPFCSFSHIVSEIHHKNVRETLRNSPTLERIIDTSTATINENSTMEIKDIHKKIKSILLSVNFRKLRSNFDELLKNQA